MPEVQFPEEIFVGKKGMKIRLKKHCVEGEIGNARYNVIGDSVNRRMNMTMRQKMEREKVRSTVLTLRLTQAEMLRFKLAALNLGKKRAQLVREGVWGLISGTPTATAVGAGGNTVTKGEPVTGGIGAGQQGVTGGEVVRDAVISGVSPA